MAGDGESLESWLNKATNPSNRQEDWEYIMGFCDQIKEELEGPLIATRLLAHKIQSPQEWEAMQALTVLEACIKNCSGRFHNEVGKFRFLNELIKVVSPKYFGDRISEKVKNKVIEILYGWTVSLPNETKISDAYEMLKKQGIVMVDPEIPHDNTLKPSPSLRPKNPVFENEEKSRRLAELLKSKKPEDLQEANRLIKNMVKEDEVRTQKEEVDNSVTLLNDMSNHFSAEFSTVGDQEIIRELYGDCDKLRQTVFKLATETEDNDSHLGNILQASDDLSRVINSYKRIVEGQAIHWEAEGHLTGTKPPGPKAEQSEVLIDLVGLDLQAPPAATPNNLQAPPSLSLLADLFHGTAPPATPKPEDPSTALLLLGQELLSLGIVDPAPVISQSTITRHEPLGHQWTSLQDSISLSQHRPQPASLISYLLLIFLSLHSFTCWPPVIQQHLRLTSPQPCFSPSMASNGILQDLALLDLGSHKPLTGMLDAGTSSLPMPLLLGGLPAGPSGSPPIKSQADDSPLLISLSPVLALSGPSPVKGQEISLSSVKVSLKAIKPSKVCPVTAYDKYGIRVLLHFASDCPPDRPDVLVMVASMLNVAPLPVHNIVLQAAVPNSMKLRIQSPSGTELAAFNPILPPAAITQIILLANPLKEKVRMRYKLAFTLGEQPCTEVGEVEQFPPAD
ncbi:hypothetical protein NHX12_018615, partial [Muraenolepis orangiensis]